MPSLFLAIDPLHALSGFLVGCIVGLTGVGGGSLMTPLLVLAFGVHPVSAVGTDLLYAGLTKMVGTVAHGRHGSVNWRIVGWLAAGSIPASAATLLWFHLMGARSDATAHIVAVGLGVALLVTAASLVFRKQLLALARAGGEMEPRRQAMFTVIAGAVIGVLVSVSSVGAGAIGAVALLFLYPGLPARVIVGSDIAHAVPLTLVAGAGFWAMGAVNFPLLVSLLVGSVPGILVGSSLAPRVPDGVLRPVLAAVLAIIGLKLVLA